MTLDPIIFTLASYISLSVTASAKEPGILSLIMNGKKQVAYTTSVYFLVLFVCKAVAVMGRPLLGCTG